MDTSFPSIDGCNNCQCDSDGSVGCTKQLCECDPAAEWYRNYVGNSPEQCAVIDFGCFESAAYFDNACGCGCEQSAECPPFFDCSETGCDLAKIAATCPYSQLLF
jgi:hypothetical protein